jgi:SWI/SNF-related matrix-associated actin-dependent regulator 1 of chromatin subfamily A
MSATPPLRDYQDKGAAWICEQLRRHKAVLCADEMGLGKCREALTAAERLQVDRVLIVCPAGARRVWQAEIKRWFPGWMGRVVLVEPGSRPADFPVTPLILIVGYDELSDLKSLMAVQLGRRHWDLLILDEAHYLKNPSNRTLALYGRRGSDEGIQRNVDKVLLLTGTPTPNHAGELWQHYRAFWPEMLSGGRGRPLSQTEFEERFCRYRDTVFGRQVTGSKNQQTLRAALKSVILRRRKADVLTELPPLILQDIPLSFLSPNWIGQLKPETRVAAARLDYTGRSADDDEFLHALRNPDTAVATVRRELGLLKVRPTILWVQERMASTGKLLLFAWHHDVIGRLARGLSEFSPVVVTGNTSGPARALAVEDFQQSPATRVFVGQTLAAGTAITLTAASEVAVVEPSWVPGENYQAICRAHRLGQRDMVLASFLYLPGTLDQRIMQVFRRKATEIGELQGDSDGADADQRSLRPGDRRRTG